jgi:hypothetical protein
VKKKETKMDLGNEMVEECATIIMIDKPRGIATMVRKTLIKFKQVLIQELISNLFVNKIQISII